MTAGAPEAAADGAAKEPALYAARVWPTRNLLSALLHRPRSDPSASVRAHSPSAFFVPYFIFVILEPPLMFKSGHSHQRGLSLMCD